MDYPTTTIHSPLFRRTLLEMIKRLVTYSALLYPSYSHPLYHRQHTANHCTQTTSAQITQSCMEVNGETGNLTLTTHKLLNRSSPKVAYMIMSWITTHTQNLVTIPRFFSPYAWNCASKMFTQLLFFRFLPMSHSQGPEPILKMQNMLTMWFRARMCIFGVRKQKFNI